MSLVNPFSERFMWVGSSAIGSSVDDDVAATGTCITSFSRKGPNPKRIRREEEELEFGHEVDMVAAMDLTTGGVTAGTQVSGAAAKDNRIRDRGAVVARGMETEAYTTDSKEETGKKGLKQ